MEYLIAINDVPLLNNPSFRRMVLREKAVEEEVFNYIFHSALVFTNHLSTGRLQLQLEGFGSNGSCHRVWTRVG